jgi:hypothetical protein
MPSPIAVPPPTTRVGMAFRSCCVFVVGGTRTAALPEKSTMPILGPPDWDLMNAAAAFSAAVIRLGLTSVSHIEPETSRVSMIVSWAEVTGTVACGRAAPITRTAIPTARSATGMRRRQLLPPGTAVLMSAIDVTLTVARRRRRLVSHQAARSAGSTSSASRAQGQEKVIVRSPGLCGGP